MLYNIQNNRRFTVFRIRPPVNAVGRIWNTATWQDKAGAYGIQELSGMLFVERIEGDFYNVVGLPIGKLYFKLKELGLL
jgi:septum formation protein